MDLKLAMVIVMLSLAMYPESDAWFVRVRRIVRAVRRVWTPVCSLTCPRGCSALKGGSYCEFICQKACGRKRRDAHIFTNGTHVTFLPQNFDFYDLNDDGYVEKSEIALTFGHKPDELGLTTAFNTTDIDEDGRLTAEELFSSKVFVFAPIEEKEANPT